MKKLIQFELRKIFSRRLTQAALIALFLLSVLLDFSAYQNMYASDGISNEGTGRIAVEIDKAIAGKYKGLLTDEKVQQMMIEFKPKQDLHGMNAAYLYQNALQSALFRNFSDLDGNWNGYSVSDVYGNEEINIGYTYGWLNTSQNMVKIFIVLSLVVVIMTAPVFSGEYGGVDNIILTSKYGKTKCGAAKIIGSILAALIITAVVSAINLIYAFILYGSSGLDCSILFAPADFAAGYIPFNITCGTLLKYQILLAFTSIISVTGITLVLSAVCKNQTVALVASAAIYLFPVMLPVSETSTLFKIITLLPLYHAQFVFLMSVEQIRGNVLYALMAVPVALIFMGIGVFISRRVFAKHQVL
ncbi:ABC transporter permease [Mediterraneibacter agrestimuris]|uniref:ABC transporter permease n=1 Tax=Mediterraneibacter agrestimuris TaxID=2941333 RepID=UPI00203D454C|nr:ABC transporter permease [Mediterraneibacter agrestimuris]